MLVTSHVFKNWNEIPNISHLLEVKNNYIRAFEHGCKDALTYVCYISTNDKVVAFGSATYFGGDENYYVDSDDDVYTEKQQSFWKLWVEGLISIKKGCGSAVLKELEAWLSRMAEEHKVEKKVINIMSVEESVGFYEENGYVECYTGPRFGGTGNIRVARATLGSSYDISLDVQLSPIDNYPTTEDSIECLEWDIAKFILQGRRIPLLPYIIIPNNIPISEYKTYVLEQPFAEYITPKMRANILERVEEMDS